MLNPDGYEYAQTQVTSISLFYFTFQDLFLSHNRDECGVKIDLLTLITITTVPIRIVLGLILIEILDIIGWVNIYFKFQKSFCKVFFSLENGASANPCSETYAGPNPDSELETQSLQNFINQSLKNWDAYLTFHSYGQYWIYPWGFASHMPDDYIELVCIKYTLHLLISKTKRKYLSFFRKIKQRLVLKH